MAAVAELGSLGGFAHMSADVSSQEYARRIVGSHTRGLIGPGEVWNQMIDHVALDALSEFMSQLTPELHTYFQRVILLHTAASIRAGAYAIGVTARVV